MRSITLIIDPETGLLAEEVHRLNGRLHRDPREGPARISWSAAGRICSERYYWRGRMHRPDGPALIDRWHGGVVEEYYRHGLVHRDPNEGPARLERTPEGLLLIECYALYDELFRDPAAGPNYCERNIDGTVTCAEYSEPGEPAPTSRRRPRLRLKAGPEPSP